MESVVARDKREREMERNMPITVRIVKSSTLISYPFSLENFAGKVDQLRDMQICALRLLVQNPSVSTPWRFCTIDTIAARP